MLSYYMNTQMRKMRKMRKTRKMRKMRKTQKGGSFMDFFNKFFSFFSRRKTNKKVYDLVEAYNPVKFTNTETITDPFEKFDKIDLNTDTIINPFFDELSEFTDSNEHLDIDCKVKFIKIENEEFSKFGFHRHENYNVYIPTKLYAYAYKSINTKLRDIPITDNYYIDYYFINSIDVDNETEFFILIGENMGKIGRFVRKDKCHYTIRVDGKESDYHIKDLMLVKYRTLPKAYDGGKSKRKRRRNISQKRFKGLFK